MASNILFLPTHKSNRVVVFFGEMPRALLERASRDHSLTDATNYLHCHTNLLVRMKGKYCGYKVIYYLIQLIMQTRNENVKCKC